MPSPAEPADAAAGQPARAEPAPLAPRAFWPLLLLVLALGFGLRLRGWDYVVWPNGLWLQDPDTVRWLARLAALAHADHYPVVETLDGFPDGTISHWTRPMGWVIRALDPLCHWLLPQANTWEAGAAFAGPVLSVLATLVLALCARVLLGPAAALGVALLHTLTGSVWNASWFGIGDHQNLQHLCLAGSFGLLLLALRGLRPWLLAAGAGALLATSLWVSAEVQLLLVLVALALVGTELLLPEDPVARPVRAGFLAGLLATALVGHLAEHPGDLGAYAWDQLSWMQLHQILVLGGFVALLRVLPLRAGRGRALAAAALALALGLLPFLFPGYRAAFGAQLQAAAATEQWAGNDVSEFRHAFVTARGASLLPALTRFSWLLPLWPLCWWCVLRRREWPLRLRVVLATLAAGTLAAGLWEVKLAHFAGVPGPLVTAAGATALGAWLARRQPARPWLRWLPLLAAVAVQPLSGVPAPRGENVQDRSIDLPLQELCDVLRQRASLGGRSVLAPWELGAQLLYRAQVPVVAAAYHRNLAGIHDQYRAFLATPQGDPELRALLQRRRVGLVVQWVNRSFFATAPRVLGLATRYFASDGNLAPAVQDTLYWRLRYGPVPAGFTLWYTSQADVVMPDQSREPVFRVYAVELPR